jgi:hypothetical protein
LPLAKAAEGLRLLRLLRVPPSETMAESPPPARLTRLTSAPRFLRALCGAINRCWIRVGRIGADAARSVSNRIAGGWYAWSTAGARFDAHADARSFSGKVEIIWARLCIESVQGPNNRQNSRAVCPAVLLCSCRDTKTFTMYLHPELYPSNITNIVNSDPA